MPVPSRRLPMFPLSTVLFPFARLPLHVFEPRYQALVADGLSGDRRFGIVLIARGSEVGGGDKRVDVGTSGHIEAAQPIPEGRWHLVIEGMERIRVTAWHPDDPYPRATVEAWPPAQDPVQRDLLQVAEAQVRRARALLSELGEGPAVPPDLRLGDDPDAAAWRLCALAPVGVLDRQRLLDASTIAERLELLLELAGAVAQDTTKMLEGG